MALYEGLRRAGAGPGTRPDAVRRGRPLPAPARPAPPAAWRRLEVSAVPAARPGAPWLDALLGRGSQRAWEGLFGRGTSGGGPRARAEAPPARRAAPPAATVRMRVVGAGEDALAPARLSAGRAVLVGLGLLTAAACVKAWRTLGPDVHALFRVPPAFAPAVPDAARLAALPLQASTGRPLALWRDPQGRWWRADAAGVLAPCPDPDAPGNLGLPQLTGVSDRAEPYRGGRRMVLALPEGLLGGLLPLDGRLAGEIRSVDLRDPGCPALATFDGARCLLGGGDWARRQGRLALVLADLAARRRRAASIDLRYEGTAVVRPLGR